MTISGLDLSVVGLGDASGRRDLALAEAGILACAAEVFGDGSSAPVEKPRTFSAELRRHRHIEAVGAYRAIATIDQLPG